MERDSDEDDEDDDEPGATGFPVSLQSVVNEASELFEAVLEHFDEEVAVLLEAAEFFRDAGNMNVHKSCLRWLRISTWVMMMMMTAMIAMTTARTAPRLKTQ